MTRHPLMASSVLRTLRSRRRLRRLKLRSATGAAPAALHRCLHLRSFLRSSTVPRPAFHGIPGVLLLCWRFLASEPWRMSWASAAHLLERSRTGETLNGWNPCAGPSMTGRDWEAVGKRPAAEAGYDVTTRWALACAQRSTCARLAHGHADDTGTQPWHSAKSSPTARHARQMQLSRTLPPCPLMPPLASPAWC